MKITTEAEYQEALELLPNSNPAVFKSLMDSINKYETPNHKGENMTFMEAVECLKRKKSVKRATWGAVAGTLFLDKDGKTINNRHYMGYIGKLELTRKDYEAKDWEVVNDWYL